ncbi:unnamed protein product [Clonostachys rhizophaga]|uniref:Zn(2)-C6 fungal-type domain-containing protein n=1 Tax=Clonostachys rhizophaga TaxID=160324 RepID=A0A9N9YEK8_9HYPO|nr:unnamed protein product [Clonostachys rhizophaga]
MQSTEQGLDPGNGPAGPEDAASRRACDQCRLKKIRCDKDWPCSNCRMAKRSCTSTGAGQRPKETRQRYVSAFFVHPPTSSPWPLTSPDFFASSERKIDRIEGRLENIEAYLKHIASTQSQPATDPGSRSLAPTPITGSSIPTTASSGDIDSSDNESAFGGDSALTAQTAFASEFLENAVQRTSLREADPSIKAALATLGQLVEMQKQKSVSHGPRFPLQKPVPAGGVTKLPMPPIEVVVPLLKDAKNTPMSLFNFVCHITGLLDFDSLCRMVYFPTEDISLCHFIVVNAGLYNLFVEQGALAKDQAHQDEYRAYGLLCQANMETALANLPFFLSPKIETIQALILGAQYSIDVSRPSVAWYLNSTAAQLCQTAGFHRAERVAGDPPHIKKVKASLFWNIYTIDKNLGLRLGRSSVIQECDISIERSFDLGSFVKLPEGAPITDLWVQTAALQGRIYEQLYSPSALQSDPAELARRARELAAECERLEVQLTSTRDETVAYLNSVNSSEIITFFLKGDEIGFHVTLTLVYQALPAPENSVSRFCDKCLESARKAMDIHKESIGLMGYGPYFKALYVHWSLMLIPFAPFFILFCYVIETQSRTDLMILHEFVESLGSLRDVSESAEKLHRMFQVMRDVASVYVEAKSQQQQDQTMIPIGDEFDMYLNQLGFIPNEDHTMNQGNVPNGGQVPGQEPTGDWFAGSQNIFGLLEEDLSQIDGSRWTRQ